MHQALQWVCRERKPLGQENFWQHKGKKTTGTDNRDYTSFCWHFSIPGTWPSLCLWHKKFKQCLADLLIAALHLNATAFLSPLPAHGTPPWRGKNKISVQGSILEQLTHNSQKVCWPRGPLNLVGGWSPPDICSSGLRGTEEVGRQSTKILVF